LWGDIFILTSFPIHSVTEQAYISQLFTAWSCISHS
jgi:hypothetical protein